MILSLSAVYIQPQPANDNCANAIPVGNVINLPFDTSDATFDGTIYPGDTWSFTAKVTDQSGDRAAGNMVLTNDNAGFY